MSFFKFWKIPVGDFALKVTVACVSSVLHRDFDRRFTAAAVIFAAGCVPSEMAAAAAESHAFSIPTDVASKTLQKFAE